MASKPDDLSSVHQGDEDGSEPSNGPAFSSSGPVLIDLGFVRALIAAVDESGVDTLEINRGGTRVRISKSPIPGAVNAAAAVPVAAAPAGTPAAPAADATAAQEPAPAPTRSGPALSEIQSPMVGTFYRAPAPEAPPYVEVGSAVSRGQTLCILEAMKLMNELECEIEGVVREILVENADPVEFGQVLFRIETTGSGA